jgi:AmmeMemoRadiSam system protein B
LGVAEIDKEFGRLLVKNGLEHNETAHEGEHSIEVQIPFLQYVFEHFKFVPIIISDYAAVDIIKKTVEQAGKKIMFIASSDFTHYGRDYGYVPFKTDIKNNMHKLDAGAIEQIKKIDSKGFLNYVNKTNATICGKMPIAAMLSCIKSKQAELLKYYTSADISGSDYSTAVGYASIRFF